MSDQVDNPIQPLGLAPRWGPHCYSSNNNNRQMTKADKQEIQATKASNKQQRPMVTITHLPQQQHGMSILFFDCLF